MNKLERMKRWLTSFFVDEVFDRQMDAIERKDWQTALLNNCLERTDLLLFLFDGYTLNKDALRLYVDARRHEFVDPQLTYNIVINELAAILDGMQFIQVLIEVPKILNASQVQINAD